jgi:acetyl-CoA carboxylase carboxyl transferase subunit beta
MSSTWFRRNKKGILTTTEEKKETPDGLWHKCPECKATVTVKELHDNLYICHKCNYHNRINAKEYFGILFDNNKYELLFENIAPKDFLGFVDVKPYGRGAKNYRFKGCNDRRRGQARQYGFCNRLYEFQLYRRLYGLCGG